MEKYFPSVTLKRNTFSKDVCWNYIQVLYVDSETFFMADVFGIWRRMCKLITLKSNCTLQLSYCHDAAVHADSLACLPAALDETEPLLMTFELLLLWQISKSLLWGRILSWLWHHCVLTQNWTFFTVAHLQSLLTMLPWNYDCMWGSVSDGGTTWTPDDLVILAYVNLHPHIFDAKWWKITFFPS